MAKADTAEQKASRMLEKIDEAVVAAGSDPKKQEHVRNLRKQLGEHLADGADKCKNCGYEVVGMLKTPSYYDARNDVQMPAVWEVGCVICPPVYVESDRGVDAKLDGKKKKVVRRSYSARGTSIEQARDKWNNGEFVEDTKFGLNVAPGERARLELLASD
jgi:predicted Zn-ribbon and HTH transcriptional regulator